MVRRGVMLRRIQAMKYKKWNIGHFDQQAACTLADQTGLSVLAAAVLQSRGIQDARQASFFADDRSERLHDPFLMRGMREAVEEIAAGLARGDQIAVYGDYDADGVSATCLLVSYLRAAGADCMYYIPDRITEGYGLNAAAVDHLFASGARLLITVDTGIAAVDEVAHAKSLGMRVVVTDHHECKEQLPDAHALIDPKRPDCDYPFAELAGVGVAFKLICALDAQLSQGASRLEELLADYAELVTLGTIADVMPLVNENRIFASRGIRSLQKPKNKGLRALLREINGNSAKGGAKPVSSRTVSFMLAPRINAAGRLGHADEAAALLFAASDEEAADYAGALCRHNRDRQGVEAEMLAGAVAMLADFDAQSTPVIVLWNEGWHHGVAGIVAAKLADRYGVPAVIVCIEEGGTEGEARVGRGSGRSVAGFNLFAAVESASAHLLRAGGHEQAVGLSAREEDLPAFAQSLSAYAVQNPPEPDAGSRLHIDCALTSDMLTLDAVDGLTRLEPFGEGNAQPVFSLHGVCVESLTPIGNGKHMRVGLRADGCAFGAVFFGVGEADMAVSQGDWADAAFCAEINDFRGREVQLVLRDLRPASGEHEKKLYEEFQSGGLLTAAHTAALLPARSDCVAVWRYLVGTAHNGEMVCAAGELASAVSKETGKPLGLGRLLVCMDVFCELGLLHKTHRDGRLYIQMDKNPAKKDMADSTILRRLMRA